MARKGVDTHVITRSPSHRTSDEKRDGFWVHRVWFLNVRLQRISSYAISTILEAIKLRPDSIVSFGIFPDGFLAVLLGKILRRPSLVIAFGDDIYLFPPWTRAAVKFTLSHCDLPISLTNYMKSVMRAVIQNDKEIAILPNGIDPTFFKIDRSGSRARLGIDQKQLVLLFVGRLEKVKGIEFLLNAMPSILLCNRNVLLLIVGQGQERKNLELICNTLGIRANVEFVGLVQHSEVSKYMCASDLFILPSISEGFPLVLVEVYVCWSSYHRERFAGIE